MDAKSDDAARDRALALAARGGDRQAFASLVRRHQARLFNFLLRLLGRREVAMDLTQDTFLKAWSALPDWQPAARFSTWLFQIGRNAAFDVLRRQQRIDFVSYDAGNPADEPGDSAPSPEQQYADRQRLRLLERALAALPAEQREILLLRELEDMSYAELAVTLGINEGTVKSRLARARAAALLHYRDYTGEHRDE
ncbi:RNA polymerase sigma factor [Azonexus hydrophilus]|uniref:RNA polymerase sigma factor n=1 Tax=Azonexus hydrophilus TaxID=418702 RepID=UPI0019628524|nr:RNA polymerase sigma factor [Azonexus hydrophilus]